MMSKQAFPMQMEIREEQQQSSYHMRLSCNDMYAECFDYSPTFLIEYVGQAVERAQMRQKQGRCRFILAGVPSLVINSRAAISNLASAQINVIGLKEFGNYLYSESEILLNQCRLAYIKLVHYIENDE